jgi:hypothetical protein
MMDILRSVGTATGFGLDGRGLGCDSRQRFFSLLHSVQTGSSAHTASYSMGTGDISLGVKRQGREADHSPSYSAEI